MDISILQNPPVELTQPGPAGFFPYDREEARAFAFFWTDGAGRALLLSKAYKSARSRDRVLEKVKSRQYEIRADKVEAGRPRVEILNKNQQVVAASLPLREGEDAAALIRQMQVSTKQFSDQKGKARPDLAAVVTDQPTRHSFRLLFYRSNQDQEWQGMLAHPLSDQKVNFSGVDAEEITAFIEKQLAKKEIAPTMEAKPLPKQLEVDWPEQQHLPTGQSFAVGCSVQPGQPGARYVVSISAQAMDGGEKTLISSQQFASSTDTQYLNLEATTTGLEPGIYRLIAQVDSVDAERSQPIMENTQLMFMI